MKKLLIIPAYNEEDSILITINDIKTNSAGWDYVIINDGSSDKTIEICKENKLNVLNLESNLGLAGAFETGMKYALKNNYDYAVQFDADGQHMAVYLDNLLDKAISNNSDIVIGSRFATVKKPYSLRMLGSRFIALSIFLVCGKLLTDPTSGMRLFNKRTIKKMATNINLGPEPDTIAYLLKEKFTFSEAQVEMRERVNGISYFNLYNSLKYMLRMSVSILILHKFR